VALTLDVAFTSINRQRVAHWGQPLIQRFDSAQREFGDAFLQLIPRQGKIPSPKRPRQFPYPLLLADPVLGEWPIQENESPNTIAYDIAALLKIGFWKGDA
jgi:hypothetical protein